MADLTWEFGLYYSGDNSFRQSNDHWFFDNYWNGGSEQVAIRVTNNSGNTVYLLQMEFSLINGNSNGQSFSDNNGRTHTTYSSTATITAHCNGVDSNSVTVDCSKQVFQLRNEAGQSYWQPRPSNSSGSPNPDTGCGYDVQYYTFIFKNGVELQNGGSAIITFTATWSTGGEHCIQIYATNGIIVPVTHKVIWLFKNGYCPRGGSGDGSGCTYSKGPCSITGDCCQYIQESQSATKPDTPVRDQYDFMGWNPSDDAWESVTTDFSYEALWTESGIIWVYSAKDNKWEKKLKPHKYGNNESTNGKGWYDLSSVHQFSSKWGDKK